VIRLKRVANRTRAYLACDVCQLPIDVDHQGMAMWEADKLDAGVQHIHKGRCDGLNDPGGRRLLHWVDADVHLIFIRNNFGLTGDAEKEAEARAIIMASE
jgi:hypothetical protein